MLLLISLRFYSAKPIFINVIDTLKCRRLNPVSLTPYMGVYNCDKLRNLVKQGDKEFINILAIQSECVQRNGTV